LILLWLSIIIDALDECDREVLENGGFISRLLHSAPATCRILFSSRHIDYIADQFAHWSLVKLGDEGTTQSSLRHYTSWRISQVKQIYCAEDVNSRLELLLDKPELLERLLEKAQDMFLYLFYLFKTIIDARHLGASGVHELLLNPPSSLDSVYATILARHLLANPQSIGGTEAYDRILICALQLIFYSCQPVTWSLLCSVLSSRQCGYFRVAEIRRCMAEARGSLFEERKALDGTLILAPPHETWRSHFADFEYDPDALDGVPRGTELSRDIKSVVNVRLPRLYGEVRRVPAHRSLFEAGSRVLCDDRFGQAIVQYHNSTDARRRILDVSSHWGAVECARREWDLPGEEPEQIFPDVDFLSPDRRQKVDVWRLRSQLFWRQGWAEWLHCQSNFLEADRQWRAKRIEAMEDFALRHGDRIRESETYRKDRDTLEDIELQSSLGQEALTLLVFCEERELLSYSYQ
jgi:hypothetical protein